MFLFLFPSPTYPPSCGFESCNKFSIYLKCTSSRENLKDQKQHIWDLNTVLLYSVWSKSYLLCLISPLFYRTDVADDIDNDKKENDDKPLLCRLYCQKSLIDVSHEDAKLRFKRTIIHPSISSHFPIHVKRLKLSQWVSDHWILKWDCQTWVLCCNNDVIENVPSKLPVPLTLFIESFFDG